MFSMRNMQKLEIFMLCLAHEVFLVPQYGQQCWLQLSSNAVNNNKMLNYYSGHKFIACCTEYLYNDYTGFSTVYFLLAAAAASAAFLALIISASS